MRTINVKYYKQLEAELAHCLVHNGDGNFLSAFLHLYRAVEKVAVAFPLTYISSQSDFERVIEGLRPYFENRTGELAFAQKFTEAISAEFDGLVELNIDMVPKSRNRAQFDLICGEMEACLGGLMEGAIDRDAGKISVPFTKMPSVLITCRNRLFHFSNDGQRNFDIDKMGDVQELCQMLVGAGLHWLALSFDEVWKKQSTRVILIA